MTSRNSSSAGPRTSRARPPEVDDATWTSYLFTRENPAGVHLERWVHRYGCGRWFNVARDTRTHEILKTYAMGEPKPDASGRSMRRPRGPYRLPHGGQIDRTRKSRFALTVRTYCGHPGDTLASALLANGVRTVARSFKFHRPRGVFSCGVEEPNALAAAGIGARRHALRASPDRGARD